jgi:putative flippase GtrA
MQTKIIDSNAHGMANAMLSLTMKKIYSSRNQTPRPCLAYGRIQWFLAVGCAAAAVHWCAVVALVRHVGWPALLANVVGWLVAFVVSFTGHHCLTFRGHGSSTTVSVRRFFMVSAFGFSINEAIYALLLGWGWQRFDLALLAVLLAVAVLTYFLSRHWAFFRNASASDLGPSGA